MYKHIAVNLPVIVAGADSTNSGSKLFCLVYQAVDKLMSTESGENSLLPINAKDFLSQLYTPLKDIIKRYECHQDKIEEVENKLALFLSQTLDPNNLNHNEFIPFISQTILTVLKSNEGTAQSQVPTRLLPYNAWKKDAVVSTLLLLATLSVFYYSLQNTDKPNKDLPMQRNDKTNYDFLKELFVSNYKLIIGLLTLTTLCQVRQTSQSYSQKQTPLLPTSSLNETPSTNVHPQAVTLGSLSRVPHSPTTMIPGDLSTVQNRDITVPPQHGTSVSAQIEPLAIQLRTELIQIGQIAPLPGQPDVYATTFSFACPQHPLLSHLGEIRSTMNLTKPYFKPTTDQREAEAMKWAESLGVFDGKFLDLIKRTYTAGLEGTCYPDEDKNEARLHHFILLFLQDDGQDEALPEGGDINPNEAKINKLLQTLRGQRALEETDSKKIKAFHELYTTTPEFQSDPYFLDTLELYLINTLKEEAFEKEGKSPDEQDAIAIRVHTSGAYHSLVMGCSTNNIDTKTMLKKYPILETMLIDISKCIGFSNDIYSFFKEILTIEKKLTALGKINDQTTPEERLELIRQYPSMNMVHIKWQHFGPQSLTRAFEYVTRLHNESMTNFKDNEKSLVDLKIDQTDKSAITYMKAVMNGWGSHPFWAREAARYNQGQIKSNQDHILELKNRIEIARRELSNPSTMSTQAHLTTTSFLDKSRC